jgi:hypothetical protein
MAASFFGSAPTATGVNVINKHQRRLLKALTKFQRGQFEAVPDFLQGFPTFDEEIPGLTEPQLASLASLEEYARGIPQMLFGLGQSNLEAQRGVQSTIDEGFDEEAFGKFFEGAIQAPLMESLIQDILPGIRGASAPDFLGSERRASEGQAVENLVDTLAQQRSGLAYQGRESALNRSLTGYDLLGNLLNQQASLETALPGMEAQLLGLFDVPRQVDISQRDARLQEFMRQIAQLNAMMGIANQTALNPTKSAVSVAGQSGFNDQFGGEFGGTLGSGFGQMIIDFIRGAASGGVGGGMSGVGSGGGGAGGAGGF